MSGSSYTPADVDCVIVAHNGGPLLVEAVASAAAELGESRVWVMDAESADGSIEPVRRAFPEVHVVRVPNKGFSASNNRGIEATCGEWVLLLNPDAMIERGSVARMIATAGDDPGIGMVGPLVLTPEGAVQEDSFGRFPSLLNRIVGGLARRWRRLAGSGVRVPPGVTDVDWITGACMLVRRSAIEKAGAMDEAFFLYYEDVEWCHRLHDHGFRIVIDSEARCTHHLGKAGAPSGVVAAAYRESFYRYCDLYGLWGLKLSGSVAVGLRRLFGGRL